MTRRGCRRLAAVAVFAILVGTLAGCGPASGPVSPGPVSSRPGAIPSVLEPTPASLAGGACLLLDYDVIKSTIGTQFNVAASAVKSGTYTCVVQDSQASYPDLTLAITATDLATSDFKSTVVPHGSTPVTKLGKIGYEIVQPAGTGVGPTIEIGWLSGNDRLIVMRYTFDADASMADASALLDKMIELARKVDITTV